MISHIFLIFFKVGNEFKINGPETNYGIAIPKWYQHMIEDLAIV